MCICKNQIALQRYIFEKLDLHMIVAAKRRTALSGGAQSAKNGCNTLLANVKDMIAFPAGMIIINADQRYKNPGNSPNASLIYA